MKKLVVLLASAMMFSFSATAFAATAFTDMADQTKVVNDAVNKGVALEIIEGYADGTFRPDATITRAEFAKIAVTAAGAEKTATMLEGTASEFSDVQANAWYTGWVNAAASLGLVQGDQGAYRPNDTITNAEVITVLMRLLGYNDNLTGAWPTNYITEANKQEVLDDVTISASAAATRADVAVILDAVLGTDMVKYSKDTETFELTVKDGETLLADSFKGHVTEEITLAAATLKDAEDLTFKVAGMDAAYDVVVGGEANLLSLEGHKAEIIFDVDKNNNKTAKYIDVTSYTVVTGDVEKASKGEIEVNGKDYDVVSEAAATAINTVIEEGKNSKYTVFFNEDDEVYAVSTDKKSDLASDYVNETTASIISEIDEDEITTLNNLVDGDDTFEFDAEEQILIDAATGKLLAVEDLEKGMVISNYYGDADIFVVSELQTGEFTRISGSKYTIGGTAYVATGAQLYNTEFEAASESDAKEYLGEEVSYFVNADNTITEMVTGEVESSVLYGVVVDVEGVTSSIINKVQTITVFTQEGKTVTYEISDDCDAPANGYTSLFAGAVSYKLDAEGMLEEISVEDLDEEVPGELLSAASVTVTKGKYIDDKYTLASDVVIFNIGEDDGDLEVSLLTRAEVLAEDTITTEEQTLKYDTHKNVAAGISALALDDNAIEVLVVVGYDSTSTDYKYGIVDAFDFKNADKDHNITFVGDDNEYELVVDDTTKTSIGDADAFVKYTVSGNKVTIEEAIEVKTPESVARAKVTSVNDGLVSLKDASSIKMDADTLVFIYDESDDEFKAADQKDVEKGAFVLDYASDLHDDEFVDVIILVQD